MTSDRNVAINSGLDVPAKLIESMTLKWGVVKKTRRGWPLTVNQC